MAAKGYWQAEANVTNAMVRIFRIIDQLPPLLRSMSEEELTQIPAPGVWSKKQVIGHLVDSGLNNLRRFTEAQYSPQPYIIQSYRQDELVSVNHYQELAIDYLLDLWQLVNRQIIHVVNYMPEEKRAYLLQTSASTGETVTLGWLICDYVGHLEHHLKGIVKMDL